MFISGLFAYHTVLFNFSLLWEVHGNKGEEIRSWREQDYLKPLWFGVLVDGGGVRGNDDDMKVHNGVGWWCMHVMMGHIFVFSNDDNKGMIGSEMENDWGQ